MLTLSSQPNEVHKPALSDTVLVRAPLFLYNKSLGRYLNKQTPEYLVWEAEGEQGEVDEATATLQAALPPNANGEARKRKSKARS